MQQNLRGLDNRLFYFVLGQFSDRFALDEWMINFSCKGFECLILDIVKVQDCKDIKDLFELVLF